MTTQEIQTLVERYFGKVTSAWAWQSLRDGAIGPEHCFEVAGVDVYVEPPHGLYWQPGFLDHYIVRVWHGHTTAGHEAALVRSQDLDKALSDARKSYAEHLAYFVRLATLLPDVSK